MADRKPHRRTATTQSSVSKEASPKERGTGRLRLRKKSLSNSGRGSVTAAAKPRSARQAIRARRDFSLRRLAIIAGGLVTLMLVGAITLVILSHTSAFSITSIDAAATEHVSSADIASLAGVPEGTTLLNYDEELIIENLKRNPWIKNATISRVLPDKLRITVEERSVQELVMMNSGSVVWCLGDDSVWIEPIKFDVPEGKTVSEVALESAVRMNALLVTEVPLTVNPVAGMPAEDEVFEAINAFRDELSDDLWSQIVSMNASSVEGISCRLASGLEISLGSATSISSKEAVVQQLLAKYPNRLTYINVRVPSNPSYRMVENESVESGTGIVPEVNQQPEKPNDATKNNDADEKEDSESDEGSSYDEDNSEVETTDDYDEETSDASDEPTDGSPESTYE